MAAHRRLPGPQIASVQLFFLFVMIVHKDPFATYLTQAPADGRGLNVVIRVRRERAEEARALLTEVEESGDSEAEAGSDDTGE